MFIQRRPIKPGGWLVGEEKGGGAAAFLLTSVTLPERPGAGIGTEPSEHWNVSCVTAPCHSASSGFSPP